MHTYILGHIMHSVMLAVCVSNSLLAQQCTQMHVYFVRQIFEARLSYIRSWRQTNKKPKIHKWLKSTDGITAWMFLLLEIGSCDEAHTVLQLLQSSSEASQALGDKQAITVPSRFGSHTSAEGVVCSCAALVQGWTSGSVHWSVPGRRLLASLAPSGVSLLLASMKPALLPVMIVCLTGAQRA